MKIYFLINVLNFLIRNRERLWDHFLMRKQKDFRFNWVKLQKEVYKSKLRHPNDLNFLRRKWKSVLIVSLGLKKERKHCGVFELLKKNSNYLEMNGFLFRIFCV